MDSRFLGNDGRKTVQLLMRMSSVLTKGFDLTRRA
jgi:hypothetical protein